jgi:hypothetical protein
VTGIIYSSAAPGERMGAASGLSRRYVTIPRSPLSKKLKIKAGEERV